MNPDNNRFEMQCNFIIVYLKYEVGGIPVLFQEAILPLAIVLF